jgi:hypothetical protein
MGGPSFETPVDRAAELVGKARAVRFLDLPPARAVMVDGEGSVGPDAFAPLMPGLYGTAYTLRFALKRRGVDEKVGPLEGLYRTTDAITDLDVILDADRSDWRWTLLIVLPSAATDDEIDAAFQAGVAKMDPAVAPRLRLGTLAEGRVAQVLHVGPYSAERPTIELLHAAIEEVGLRPRGDHHEIYLGDPNRSAPERLKTLLRHPVEPDPVHAGERRSQA